MNSHEQSRVDQAEIKIKAILNGWILKTKDGWQSFQDIEVLVRVVKDECIRAGAALAVQVKRAQRLHDQKFNEKLIAELNEAERNARPR